MSGLNAQDQLEFNNARTRAFLRSILGVISGHRNDLVAWDEVKDKLKLRGMVYRGMQTVPIEKIVGSVGRYNDFDNAFLPTRNALSMRWRKINRAFYDDVSLPPVQLYKVGEVYFVLDGNHRVSVARGHGAAFIDAEVTEAETRVPPTASDLNADSLTILGEYSEFLERTRLDKLRPAQNIRFSIGGAYARLIEHVAVHRYFMGLEQRRDISEDEAVMDWYDNVYCPIVAAVRTDDILSEFPGRTEADLYLWIIDHKHFLHEASGADVSPEEAALDYAENYAPKPETPLKRVQTAVEHLAQSLSERVQPATSAAPPDED
ncbi:MAG: DUF4032 domain-containing protein [Chloroflexi bacterium]|nr:DUF4032 domain-containing protein [Chloroflexota bacterium]MCL5274975.1 DUF4032 domain-containing protein [Chloroflexota bacterium]